MIKIERHLGVQTNSLAQMVRLHRQNTEKLLRKYWGSNLNSFAYEDKGFRLEVVGYNVGHRDNVTYHISVIFKGVDTLVVVSYCQNGEHLKWQQKTFDAETSIRTIVEATDLLGIEAYRCAEPNGRRETPHTSHHLAA